MTEPIGDPRLGTMFAGYRIEAILGQGGMGVVYRAFDPRLERRVALKVLPPALAADPEARARFLQEVRLAARIRNPHIVVVYAADEIDGQLYLAMDYIQGPELRTLIERDGPLGPARAVGIVGQIADALDEAHAAGLVHRDVKPANILVEPGPDPAGPGQAWLTDFGLARLASAGAGLTRPDLVVGTPGYVAPEQIEGGQIDHRVDIYALGCVLYHALSGTIPYPRDSTRSMLWAHLWEPPPRLAERSPALAPFDPVIGQALAKQPADRFQTARAFAEAARRAAAAVDPGRASLGAGAAVAGASLVFERTAPDLVRPGMPPVEARPAPEALSGPAIEEADGPGGPNSEPVGAEVTGLAVDGRAATTPTGRISALATEFARDPGRRTARIGLAGAMVVLVVGTAIAFALGPGRPAVGASSGGAPIATGSSIAAAPSSTSPGPSASHPSPTTPPPAPSPTVRTPSTVLFDQIPADWNGSCTDDGAENDVHAVVRWGCLRNGAAAWFDQFADSQRLQTWYDGLVAKLGVSPGTGSCKSDPRAEYTWWRTSDPAHTVRGRVLCFPRDATDYKGEVVATCTDTATAVELFAVDISTGDGFWQALDVSELCPE